jgi:hypothetical protein
MRPRPTSPQACGDVGRAEQAHAALLQQLQIGLGGGVAPHRLVHRRGQGNRRIGGQHQGGQQVVGDALGQARDQVGGGRGDEDQVGPARQLDMAHGGFGGRVEQVEVHRMAGEGLQGQRGDEFAPALGHHHAHFGALILESAHQFGALVGGDAATDADDDAFAIQPLHRPAFYIQVDVRHGANASPGRPRVKRWATIAQRPQRSSGRLARTRR